MIGMIASGREPTSLQDAPLEVGAPYGGGTATPTRMVSRPTNDCAKSFMT